MGRADPRSRVPIPIYSGSPQAVLFDAGCAVRSLGPTEPFNVASFRLMIPPAGVPIMRYADTWALVLRVGLEPTHRFR